VDFPEIFDYKLPALSAAGAVSKFLYKNVVADLSLPGWTEKLLAAGFDTTRPTFWLLEGFTGYLTADEFHAVFDTMTSLSANGSHLVATFLTPDTKVLTGMHRFTPAVPIEEVTRHAGWTGTQEDIRDIGKTYGRVWTDSSMNGYMIVLADYAA
jgi:methyltransferase (TIGR00027 family)